MRRKRCFPHCSESGGHRSYRANWSPRPWTVEDCCVWLCVCVCVQVATRVGVPLPLRFVATARNLAAAGRGGSIRSSPTGTGSDRDLSSGLGTATPGTRTTGMPVTVSSRGPGHCNSGISVPSGLGPCWHGRRFQWTLQWTVPTSKVPVHIRY